MKQPQKGKKTFFGAKNGKHGAQNKSGRRDAGLTDKTRFAERAQRDDRSSDRGSKYKYQGSFDLADSFEAMEKKNAGKEDLFSGSISDSPKNQQNHQDRKRRGKTPQDKRRGGAQKLRKETGEFTEEIPVEGGIKTRSNLEYIPFDSETDDYYDVEPVYEEEYTVTTPSGKGRGRKGGDFGPGVPGAVAGRNAVRELLKSGRSVDKIYVKHGGREGSIVVIVAEAVNRKIPIIEVTQDKLDQMAGGVHHQGIVALAAEKQYVEVEDILKTAKDRKEIPLIVIADGIEDPQNLGALIRCAECAGAHGIIIPKRRAVGLTPIVAKASAGAIEHMAVAKVTNLADTIEKLKKEGIWIFAAEAGGTPYYDADFKVPAAIVLGSEGFGVSRLIKERADLTVSIPMYGQVNSLNVSAAASVILCHAARMQRT